MPDPVVQDTATGQAAFDSLRSDFLAIPSKDLRPPNTDPEQAAVRGLGAAQALKERPEVVARLKSLGSEFNAALLDKLEPAARAVLHSRSVLASYLAAASGARVSVGLVQKASDQKDRMMRLLDYFFGDEEAAPGSVAAELRDIRSGSGYLDLAQDLTRLAALYRAHSSVLEKDIRLYSAKDADEAQAIAAAIQDQLGAKVSMKDSPERELAVRAWTYFVSTYSEISAAGRWLLRKDPDTAVSLFPALINGRRGKKVVPPPPPVSVDHG